MAAGKRLRTGDPLTEHDVADRIDRAALRLTRIMTSIRQQGGMEAVQHSRYLTNAVNILAAELQAWDIRPQDSWIEETLDMDTSDKRADESWPQWAARKHDELHGPTCDCTGNPGRRVRGMPLPAALRTLDTVPEGQRTERAALPGKLHFGDPVWVLDEGGSTGWAGQVMAVSGDVADVYYAGGTEAFSLPDGRCGSRWLFLGPVACQGCDKLISPAGMGDKLWWEDPDGLTQCMKAAGPLPVPPGARVMHAPVPRIPDQVKDHG